MMSRATGEVWVNGELNGYFVYNGTVDLICPKIYPDKDSFDAIGMGRRATNEEEIPLLFSYCTCRPQTETPAILYTSYGYGYHWNGTVCLKCMAVTSTLSYADCGEDGNETEGHPFQPERDKWWKGLQDQEDD